MKKPLENVTLMNAIKIVTGIAAVVVIVIGVYTFFAPVAYVDAEVQQLRSEDNYLAMRLDLKITQDLYEQKKRDRRKIEFEFGTTDPSKLPAPYNTIYIELLEEERQLLQQIEKIQEYMNKKKYGG